MTLVLLNPSMIMYSINNNLLFTTQWGNSTITAAAIAKTEYQKFTQTQQVLYIRYMSEKCIDIYIIYDVDSYTTLFTKYIAHNWVTFHIIYYILIDIIHSSTCSNSPFFYEVIELLW